MSFRKIGVKRHKRKLNGKTITVNKHKRKIKKVAKRQMRRSQRFRRRSDDEPEELLPFPGSIIEAEKRIQDKEKEFDQQIAAIDAEIELLKNQDPVKEQNKFMQHTTDVLEAIQAKSDQLDQELKGDTGMRLGIKINRPAPGSITRENLDAGQRSLWDRREQFEDIKDMPIEEFVVRYPSETAKLANLAANPEMLDENSTAGWRMATLTSAMVQAQAAKVLEKEKEVREWAKRVHGDPNGKYAWQRDGFPGLKKFLVDQGQFLISQYDRRDIDNLSVDNLWAGKKGNMGLKQNSLVGKSRALLDLMDSGLADEVNVPSGLQKEAREIANKILSRKAEFDERNYQNKITRDFKKQIELENKKATLPASARAFMEFKGSVVYPSKDHILDEKTPILKLLPEVVEHMKPGAWNKIMQEPDRKKRFKMTQKLGKELNVIWAAGTPEDWDKIKKGLRKRGDSVKQTAEIIDEQREEYDRLKEKWKVAKEKAIVLQRKAEKTATKNLPKVITMLQEIADLEKRNDKKSKDIIKKREESIKKQIKEVQKRHGEDEINKAVADHLNGPRRKGAKGRITAKDVKKILKTDPKAYALALTGANRQNNYFFFKEKGDQDRPKPKKSTKSEGKKGKTEPKVSKEKSLDAQVKNFEEQLKTLNLNEADAKIQVDAFKRNLKKKLGLSGTKKKKKKKAAKKKPSKPTKAEKEKEKKEEIKRRNAAVKTIPVRLRPSAKFFSDRLTVGKASKRDFNAFVRSAGGKIV